MRVAFVYDRVNKIGGAEKVLLALHEIWPQAPLFTAVYDKKGAPWAAKFRVIPSFLQSLPIVRGRHEFIPFLTPFAFESFNFNSYDVVISVTSAEAKYIITKPGTLHVCYCLTPTRYLWSGFAQYLKNPGFGYLNSPAKFFFSWTAPILRMMEQVGATRPDYYLAISKTVQARIKKYYKRDSEIIYPPVEVNKVQGSRFKVQGYRNKEYFLVVSRLVPYKKVDLVVKTFNDLRWNLKIVGSGNQESYLKKIAHSNIEFLGQVSDEELICYYQNCQALVMACEEDFGIVALEAQATGKPVIAYAKGGALETVIDQKTGLFFKRPQVKDLKLALSQFNKLKFNPSDCQKNAAKFSKKIFLKNFKKFIEEKWQKKQQNQKQ